MAWRNEGLVSTSSSGQELLRVLDEGRQKAPAHEPEASHPFPVAGDHGNGLGRRDIVTRGEIRRVAIAEIGAHGFGRGGEIIARAHAGLW